MMFWGVNTPLSDTMGTTNRPDDGTDEEWGSALFARTTKDTYSLPLGQEDDV